jgi:hypothetical protein
MVELRENSGRGGSAGSSPRRRLRRANPIVVLFGIVAGGLLGLTAGYAVLLWGFAKDPFDLAPRLPDILVPAALRAIDNSGVVENGWDGVA